ncbi:MAG: hypothetical protein ACREF5_01485 [Candidatus Saccharimonadales bacterium]
MVDYFGVAPMNYSGGLHFYLIDAEEKMRPVKRTVLEEQGYDIDVILAASEVLTSKTAGQRPTDGNTLRSAQPVPIIEFAHEDKEKLDQKRKDYAELLARRQRIGMIAIKATRRKVTKVRSDYTDFRDNLVEAARKQHQDKNGTGKAFEEAARAAVIDEVSVLYSNIAEQRLALTKSRFFNRFYGWWAEQGSDAVGRRGTLKKMGALAVMGAATGLVVSAAVGTFGVGAVGAGVTAAVSRGVARNLAKQKLDSHNTQSPLVVTAQVERQTEEVIKLQEQRWRTEKRAISSKELSDAAAAGTEKAITRNRDRMLGAVVIGAATGLAFGVLGQWIHSELSINHPVPRPHIRIRPPLRPTMPPPETTPTIPPSPGITDGFHDNVFVQPGDGYTNALVDLADQKGIHLNGAQAWEAYLAVKEQVGGNLFTNDPSYVISYNDLGISRPGEAMWSPKAVEIFQQWLQVNNLSPSATS